MFKATQMLCTVLSYLAICLSEVITEISEMRESENKYQNEMKGIFHMQLYYV